MHRLSWMMILGLFLVLMGFSILLKAFFRINFPVITTLFALAFIYIGARLLTGDYPLFSGAHPWRSCRDANCAFFSAVNFKQTGKEEPKEYNIAFGKGVIDLTSLHPLLSGTTVSVNTVLGSAVVLLDPDMPVLAHSNSVFAETYMPDGSIAVFGSLKYRSPAADHGNKPALNIRTNVVLGSVKLVNSPVR